MIPYIEVIGKYSLVPTAIVEPSQCWFEIAYYDLGEFEIYAPATSGNLNALKMGNYVRIPNRPYIWVIKGVQYTFNANGARMISATGYEAKWIITRRIIMTPWLLPTNLAEAVYKLADTNLGFGAVSYRKVKGFMAFMPSYSITIEQTQATRGNLWEFIYGLLKDNKVGSYTIYDNGYIKFLSIQGRDLSGSVIFSQSMDNLLSSTYYENSEEKRTYCQVVSTFTEKEVSTDYVEEYDLGGEGIDRSEISLSANIATKYEENGVEKETTPTSDLYKSWQVQEGAKTLAEHKLVNEFNGEIDLRYTQYAFGEDFFIGDLVMIRDEYFGYEAKARIVKYTFKQDAGGYAENADYLSE